MEKIEIIPESIQLIKLSDEEYFSDKYKDYISNSRLGLLDPDEGGSVEKYNSGFQNKYSESFELGSAVHALVLQPKYFFISDIRKPSSKLGQFADKAYQYMQNGLLEDDAIKQASIDADYYSGKLTEKRLQTALESCRPYWESRRKNQSFIDQQIANNKEPIFLSEAMNHKFESCISSIESDSKIMSTLHPEGFLIPAESYNEYAIFAEMNVTLKSGKVVKMKIKGKLDNYTIDNETQEITLNDLKTTGKPVSFFMGNWVKPEGSSNKVWYDGSFQHFHYYRQMGLYLWLLSCALKATRDISYNLKANMLVVGTVDFNSKLYHVSQKNIKKGLDEFKKLIIILAEEWTKEQ